jgi:hypothetical protein
LIEFHPDIMGRQRAAAFLAMLREHRFRLNKVILSRTSTRRTAASPGGSWTSSTKSS